MPASPAATDFRVVPVEGAASARRLEPQPPGAEAIVVSGYEGGPLPVLLHDAELRQEGDPGRWLLTSAEGRQSFRARAVERFAPRPGLFEPLLAPYALRPGDRRLVRILLALLRLPGGAWLLRRWQVSRQQAPSR